MPEIVVFPAKEAVAMPPVAALHPEPVLVIKLLLVITFPRAVEKRLSRQAAWIVLLSISILVASPSSARREDGLEIKLFPKSFTLAKIEALTFPLATGNCMLNSPLASKCVPRTVRKLIYQNPPRCSIAPAEQDSRVEESIVISPPSIPRQRPVVLLMST